MDTALEQFAYIETAIGGGQNRNKICRFDEFTPPTKRPDCFATYLRFTEDIVTYVAATRNENGNPTVSGYAGPSLATFFPADFDCADDLNVALTDARTFVGLLGDRYDVPSMAIRCYFSGSKGFSVEVPSTLFGEFKPGLNTAARLKLLANELANGIDSLDTSIYESLRLWRVPNTVNGKSNLYKIPLTVDELQTLTLSQIQNMAKAPRTIEQAPDNDWEERPDLVALWRETEVQANRAGTHGTDLGDEGSRRLTRSQVARLIEGVAAHWELGRKHDLALCLAGFLAKSGVAEKQTYAIIDRLAANDGRPDDRRKAVSDTYAKLNTDAPIRGFNGLREIVSPDVLTLLRHLVDDAETVVIAGGRRYQKDADASDVLADQEPASTKDNNTSTPTPTKKSDILGSLRGEAETTPDRFVLETLKSTETIGALAIASRQDHGQYQAFLLSLREIGVKAGDLKRMEQAISRADRGTRSKFRLLSTEDGANLPRVADSLPGSPVTSDAVIPPGYKLTQGGITEESISEDGERRTVAVSPAPIVIAGRLVDVSDGSESFRLSWFRDHAWRQQTVGRGIAANAREIIGLAKQGFPVTSRTSGDVVGYLSAYEAANIDRLPKARVSSQMGWQGPKGSLGFLWGKSLLRGDGIESAAMDLENLAPSDWTEDWVAFHGADSGDMQIAEGFSAIGSLDVWLRTVRHASAYPRVALGLYASLAPPLLDVFDAGNFCIDWSNVTSSGKTTTLRVAASCWGCPNDQSANSVLGTWDSTNVFIERLTAMLNGLPLMLDETKRAKRPQDVAKVIYLVSSGHGRGRGSVDGLRRSGAGATILLSTGEAPATSFTEDGGTLARVLSLWGPPFGRADASTAPVVQAINAGIRENYGLAGPAFVQHVIARRSDWPAWRAQYNRLRNQYEARAENDPIAVRMAGYFAVLEMAALIAHEALALPWEYQETVELLWDDLVGEATQADRAASALSALISWAHANKYTFDGRLPLDKDYNERIPFQGVSGRWDKADDWTFLAIYPHRLKELLTQSGFDYESTLRIWRDRGWLETDAGETKRYTKRVRVQDDNSRLIVIKRTAIDPLIG